MQNISWWRTSFGEDEIERVINSIRNEHISQGKVTEEFEQKLSEYLNVDYVIAVSNGSMAILLALLAVGIDIDDEVIIPNRTWIATAHAAQLLGAKIVLVDVEKDRPIIDIGQVEDKITNKTKIIIPVHMNGRSADMERLNNLANKFGITIIEDAAHAIGAKNKYGFLGTQSDIGCFSLSVAKTISTGQGGFAVTHDKKLAKKLKNLRTHGVENVKNPKKWNYLGFNFRYTDIMASIGIEQLIKLPNRINHLKKIYETYEKGLKNSPFKIIDVSIKDGEVPVYNEFLVSNRKKWIELLDSKGIETRAFYPCINKANYLNTKKTLFKYSKIYENNGIYLPSGPGQSLESINFVISNILSLT